ncbi:GGDEF domain-containing protein [Petropleomorpha daqingensis]|uniref:Diguanylate cyclase (GGDEF)-like protein n=1 Tax=Petropleomorpha daqingensis TaxID=2026353 RepID=A0A853CHI0_9ACTN|nr:diguanylate cyclase (GGDEF)-like protein [Petropleomorpha daqingensis]
MLDHVIARDAAGSRCDDELPDRATLAELMAAAPELRAELRERARASGLLMCWVALLVVPAWAVIDRLVLPAQAGSSLAVRLLCDIPIALATLLLWRTRLGRERPEWLTCLVFVVVQGQVAWMVTRAEGTPYYLQGCTLAVYASGCVLVARPRWTAALVAFSWLALAVGLLTAAEPMPLSDLVPTVVFLATASLIATVAHVRRDALHRRELLTRIRLEREQERTRTLLSRLEKLSQEDTLTGLANRRRWDAELGGACAEARARGASVGLVLLDVDHFKAVNDRHGHAGGDEALRRIARLLKARVQDGDLVARLGGDELAVLMPRADLSRAVELAESLRTGVLELEPPGFASGELTVSLGVCVASGERAYPLELVSCADAQLYRAKITRNSVGAPATPTPAR